METKVELTPLVHTLGVDVLPDKGVVEVEDPEAIDGVGIEVLGGILQVEVAPVRRLGPLVGEFHGPHGPDVLDRGPALYAVCVDIPLSQHLLSAGRSHDVQNGPIHLSDLGPLL